MKCALPKYWSEFLSIKWSDVDWDFSRGTHLTLNSFKRYRFVRLQFCVARQFVTLTQTHTHIYLKIYRACSFEELSFLPNMSANTSYFTFSSYTMLFNRHFSCVFFGRLNCADDSVLVFDLFVGKWNFFETRLRSIRSTKLESMALAYAHKNIVHLNHENSTM